MLRRPLVTFALLAVTIAASALPGDARRAQGPPPTGLRGIDFDRPLPDVVFDRDGTPVALHTLYGKPVVLNLWASWCEPCTSELADFAAATRTYGQRVTVLTISSEDTGVARRYLSEHGYVLPVIEDPKKRVFDRLGVSAVPVTFVLRADGTLAHISVGKLDPGELRDSLAGLFAPPPASAPPALAPAATP